MSFPGINFQGRDGQLNFVDKTGAAAGVNGTPYGIIVKFEQMDLSFNFTPQPEELIRMDRERFNADAHLVVGSEANLFEPVSFTFSGVVSSQSRDEILEFMGVKWAQEEGADTTTWNVKGTPTAGLVSTKSRGRSDGLYSGGKIDSKGSLIFLPAFANPKKIAVDAEAMWFERDRSNTFGYRLKECNFDPGEQQIGESADFVTVSFTGMMYGQAEPIQSFSRFRDVTDDKVRLDGFAD